MSWPVPYAADKIDLGASKRISSSDAARQTATAQAILDRLVTQPGLILADEVGMGKTFVALAVAASVAWADKSRRPVVVMVPPALRDKWPRDFGVFAEKCVVAGAKEGHLRLTCRKAETGLEFLQLLDDPPSRRAQVIFLTHGALHRGLLDPWTKLAILRQALRPKRFELQRVALRRFAPDLLRTSSKTDDPGTYKALLDAPADQWRGILQAAGYDPGDDPVPEAIEKVLDKNRVDFTDLRETLAALPLRRSATMDQRLKEARRAIARALKDVWREALCEARFHSPLLILDEAHHLKNPATRLASLFVDPEAESDMAVLDGALQSRFERMLFLTATPFQLGHHELLNVLDRFQGIHWKSIHIGAERDEFMRQIEELRRRLDGAQRAAADLDQRWQEIDPADIGTDGENENWWQRLRQDGSCASEKMQVTLRSYALALDQMRSANEALKPWVIRHLRSRSLPDCETERRRLFLGASILTEDLNDHGGLVIRDGSVLPFLLAARSQVIFARMERQNGGAGARRATFAEGLASSYESFLETRSAVDARQLVDEDSDLGADGMGHAKRLNWYLTRLERSLPDPAAFSQHPKVAATAMRALRLWSQGEKVLVFCHFRRTGRAMAQHISAGLEAILLSEAAARLGTSKADADAELGRIGQRFDFDAPLGRALTDAVRDVLGLFPEFSEEDRGRMLDVVRRFVRTDAFLVRFFPLGSSSGEELETALDRADGSGLTLRRKLQDFASFMAERCTASERSEYLCALSRIQSGERRGIATLEDGYQEDIRLLGNLRLVHGGTKNEERRRVMLTFSTPFFPEILIASNVLAEGVDLHLECRYVIHHDLCWNPSTLEQRTGRIDRIDAKCERVKQPINIYLPYIAATQDEKMFRVVRDRERWFQALMGESYQVDESATDRLERRVPLPRAAAEELAMKLEVWSEA
jgi:hypothetical protein